VLHPTLLKQNPDVLRETVAAYEAERAYELRPAPGPNFTNRAVHFVPMECSVLTMIETGWPPPDPGTARLVRIGELVVTASGDGELEVATRDRRYVAPFATAIYSYLVKAMPESFKPLTGDHIPRVTVDGVVLARESWTLAGPGAVGYGAEAFLAVRRWAVHHGLPRRFFAKSPGERKPFLVDLDNPFLVEYLVKVAEKVERITISEMLPGPDELWLPDADGNLYTSELRMCAVDPAASAAR
jgi:hypothetical protein